MNISGTLEDCIRFCNPITIKNGPSRGITGITPDQLVVAACIMSGKKTWMKLARYFYEKLQMSDVDFYSNSGHAGLLTDMGMLFVYSHMQADPTDIWGYEGIIVDYLTVIERVAPTLVSSEFMREAKQSASWNHFHDQQISGIGGQGGSQLPPEIDDLLRNIDKAARAGAIPPPPPSSGFLGNSTKKPEEFLKCMNDAHAASPYDPVVGRDDEVSELVRVLQRKKKRNPVLLGDPGVGKTSIVEGLVQRIAAGNVPKALLNKQIYSLEVSSLVAGTSLRGQFEDRVRKVVEKLESMPDAICFIDEIHTIIGAGASRDSQEDVAQILKPALASGKISVIGATTSKEWDKIIEKDGAVSRRFSRVLVKEPDVSDTIAIISGSLKSYGSFHGVSYPKSIVKPLVEGAKKFIHDRHAPDSSFDVLDLAGVFAKTDSRKSVELSDIQRAISVAGRVPLSSVMKSDLDVIAGLEAALNKRVVGQESAVAQIVKSVKISKSGLGRENRPIGSYILTGPTGVGKTELAKSLSEELKIPLYRFDMSEYSEEHSTAKLFGAPPGYLGHDDGGQLTYAVANTPHCIVLLDEIEKAHPKIYAALLGVLDAGRMTDGRGRTVDFSQTTIFMTSNVKRTETKEKRKLGFGESVEETRVEDAYEKTFSPEFRNRLDGRLMFKPLTEEMMVDITKKFVAELTGKLAARSVKLKISDEAIEFLAKAGYDPEMGARPLHRVINEQLREPIACDLLWGDAVEGATVNVKVEDDKLKISLKKRAERLGLQVQESV